jgi:hypothetical protein
MTSGASAPVGARFKYEAVRARRAAYDDHAASALHQGAMAAAITLQVLALRHNYSAEMVEERIIC